MKNNTFRGIAMKKEVIIGAAAILTFSLPLAAYPQSQGYPAINITKPVVMIQHNADAAASQLSEQELNGLREKLYQAGSEKEINTAIASFDRLGGPNAGAAAVLLDYLRQEIRPGAGAISSVLEKLLTDEQVAQLSIDIETYPQDNTTSYLLPVLASRMGGPGAADSLYRLILAFQDEPWHYYYFVDQARSGAFTVPADFTRWLEKVYGGIKPGKARGVLLDAVGKLASTQASDRPVLVKWLWEIQHKEKNTALQKDCLIILSRLGEQRALDLLKEHYLNRLNTADKIQLVEGIGNMVNMADKVVDRDVLLNWLEELTKADKEAATRQACLYTLHELGNSDALGRLVEDTEKNGLALTGGHGSIAISWQVLREMVDEYPQSYLARGIKAYEDVRGDSYFAIVRMQQSNEEWPWHYGDGQYDPDREIPGWENFLKEFPRHPAADDAAYRLARCYEIEGRWADALKTLSGALTMPDGDIRYHIAGRMVYILDVQMTGRQLEELSGNELDSNVSSLVSYSLAVKKLRQDDFQGAVTSLVNFTDNLKGESNSLSPFSYLNDQLGEKYNFNGEIKKQLEHARVLQVFKEKWEKSKDPADLYNLAAAIYHNQLTYYNHLWLGQRQDFNWVGYINYYSTGDSPEEMSAFAREMINYSHSAAYFQQVYDNPGASAELKAKALYSLGLSYIGLYQWGEDAKFAFSRSMLEGKIKDTFSRFVREFPDSSMADDALLALGGYTGDHSYLERLLKDYPRGDAVNKAKKLLEEMKSPYYYNHPGWTPEIPYKIIINSAAAGGGSSHSAELSLPPDVQKWLAANSIRKYTGTLVSGGWRYILIAAGEKPTAGYGVEIIEVTGEEKVKVNYQLISPPPGQMSAQVLTYPYILARIAASSGEVEFAEAP